MSSSRSAFRSGLSDLLGFVMTHEERMLQLRAFRAQAVCEKCVRNKATVFIEDWGPPSPYHRLCALCDAQSKLDHALEIEARIGILFAEVEKAATDVVPMTDEEIEAFYAAYPAQRP